MKIILSDNRKHEGKKGIVYVPSPLLANIVAILHQYHLLPKAESLLTQRALDERTRVHIVETCSCETCTAVRAIDPARK
jgi:hypothetical protein